MRPVLAIDVDSTIWDLTAWVCDAVMEVTGETLDPEECTTWTHVLDVYGEEATMKVYERALSPERVAEREPYPHSVETLRYLQDDLDMRLHFVTHNWDPAAMTPHLEPWLKEHFGPEIGLTVTMEDKLDIMEKLGAFGMVDDRPDTIRRVAEAGLWAATKIQPWNRDLVAEHPSIHGFESWTEVPGLLPPLDHRATSGG